MAASIPLIVEDIRHEEFEALHIEGWELKAGPIEPAPEPVVEPILDQPACINKDDTVLLWFGLTISGIPAFRGSSPTPTLLDDPNAVNA